MAKQQWNPTGTCRDPEHTLRISCFTDTVDRVAVPSQEENHYENGRWFHGYRKGLYMYPCDEVRKTWENAKTRLTRHNCQAEMDRMDIYHKIFLVARHEQLHKAPLMEGPDVRILDIGTGTGIWAIDMAESVAFLCLLNGNPILMKSASCSNYPTAEVRTSGSSYLCANR